MLWIIISAVLVFGISIWLGHRKLFFLDQVSPRTFLAGTAAALAVFWGLKLVYDLGWFPELLAAGFMAACYSSIAGFFLGAGFKQFKTKSEVGTIEYVNRSFLTDLLPNIVALTLIIAGIARTSLLNDLMITPIRVSSGLSLIAIGSFALTIRLIPEFRQKGIIILDRKISWEHFLSYQWYGEDIIEFDYEFDGIIKSYRTVIPPEDHVKVEKFLSRMMMQKLEED